MRNEIIIYTFHFNELVLVTREGCCLLHADVLSNVKISEQTLNALTDSVIRKKWLLQSNVSALGSKFLIRVQIHNTIVNVY